MDRLVPVLDRSVLDSLTLDFDRLGFGKPELARRARLAFPRLAPGDLIAVHKGCPMTARFAAAPAPLAEQMTHNQRLARAALAAAYIYSQTVWAAQHYLAQFELALNLPGAEQMSPREPVKNSLEIAGPQGGRQRSLAGSLTRKPAFSSSGADAQQWVHQAKPVLARRRRGQEPEIERRAVDRRARDYTEARLHIAWAVETARQMMRPAQSSFAARPSQKRERPPKLAHVSYSRKESSIGQLPNSYPRELKWRAVRPSIRNALKA